MARTFAQVLTSIWQDEEFRALDSAAQRMYLLLLSQPNLSYSGVLPLTTRRWASLASDIDEPQIVRSLGALESAGFVVVDHANEELLIRSFMRNDGVWKQPNILIAAVKDAKTVTSSAIRQAIFAEGFRMLAIEGLSELSRKHVESLVEGFDDLSGTLPRTPPEGFPEPSGEGEGDGLGEGAGARDEISEKRTDESSGQPSPSQPGNGSADDPKGGALSALMAGYKHRHADAATSWRLTPQQQAPFVAAIEKRGVALILDALDRHVAAHSGQPPGHAVAFIPTMQEAARESAAERRYANPVCATHGNQEPCTPCVRAQAALIPPADLIEQARAGLARTTSRRPDVRDAA